MKHEPRIGKKSSSRVPTREDKRSTPKLVRKGERDLSVLTDYDDQIRDLYGTKTTDAAHLLLKSGLEALGQNGQDYFELVTSMAVEMEPRDAVEAMLITQMTATHVAMTRLSHKLNHAQTLAMSEAFERSMTRLSRTYLAQMEALKKYRSKASQIVRVERVEVREGGQAIVGDVSYQRGEHDEK